MLPVDAQTWLDGVGGILQCEDVKKAVEAFSARGQSEWKPIKPCLQASFFSAAIDVYIVFNTSLFDQVWSELKEIEKISKLIEGAGLPIHLEFEDGWAKPICAILGRQKSRQAAAIRCLISMLDEFNCDINELPVSAYQFALSVILDEEIEERAIYRVLHSYEK